MFVNDFDIELRPTAEPSEPEGTRGLSNPQI
jgi:hypothetical protein